MCNLVRTQFRWLYGEIRRYLRDNNIVRVSRSVRDLAYKTIQVRERLTKETGKEPGIEEIAKELEKNGLQSFETIKTIVLQEYYS